MRRRDFLTGAAASACAITTDECHSAKTTLLNRGFGDDFAIAFEGLDYPSWSANQLSLGFMAFLPVYAPNVRAPFTIAMSLQRIFNGQVSPLPVKQNAAYNPYRSTALNGTATDWAILPRHSATATLFIPYQCIDTGAIPNADYLKLRLYCRIIDADTNHLRNYDKEVDFSAGFEKDSYLVQRMVAPAPGPPGGVNNAARADEFRAKLSRCTVSFKTKNFSFGLGSQK